VGKPVSRKITVPDCADAVVNASRRTVKSRSLRFITWPLECKFWSTAGFARVRQASTSVSSAPSGLEHWPDLTQGLRPGLQSYAASRLGKLWLRLKTVFSTSQNARKLGVLLRSKWQGF